jgi:hypothetical protein
MIVIDKDVMVLMTDGVRLALIRKFGVNWRPSRTAPLREVRDEVLSD